MREPRLDEAPLLLVGDGLGYGLLELRQGRGRLLLLGDARPHPDHVGQGPVGHSLAVGKAAAPVVVRDLGQAVEVLEDLPGKPRLADPGDPDNRDQVRSALVPAAVEEVLDEPQFAVAPDERRLEALRLQRAAGARDDPKRAPERDEPVLALQLAGPGALVDDGWFGRTARR